MGLVKMRATRSQPWAKACLLYASGLVHVVDVQTLADDILHLLAGVQGCHGVLKDHLHLGAQGVVLAVVQLAADILQMCIRDRGYAEEASASESVSTGVLLRKDETWISIAYSEGGFGIRISVEKS